MLLSIMEILMFLSFLDKQGCYQLDYDEISYMQQR